jgi:hypothetical protein
VAGAEVGSYLLWYNHYMSWQVVKQPEGTLAIWDTTAGDFIAVGMDLEECCDFFAEEVFRGLLARTRDFARKTALVLDGTPEKAYHQFAMTWEQAQKQLAERRQ